ncbi:hypothetical protein EDD22DRAFT_955690 [Suillus occidentalis]|nr:hypothetical protein EDD22DRAFT_955690 [Suillus occidentalis]
MVFTGGPAMEDPGMVIINNSRSPRALIMTLNGTASSMQARSKGQAKRVSNNGHAVNLFAGCLDQVGLLEMKSLPNSTNGVIVLSDSFATSIIKQSFLRMFNKDDQDFLQMGSNATFDTTKEFKVSGLIGHAISAGKKPACVGETEIEANSPSITSSFDQEATTVLLARIAVFKAEIDGSPDFLCWLDSMDTRLCQKFADYRNEDTTILTSSVCKPFAPWPSIVLKFLKTNGIQFRGSDEAGPKAHIFNWKGVKQYMSKARDMSLNCPLCHIALTINIKAPTLELELEADIKIPSVRQGLFGQLIINTWWSSSVIKALVEVFV